MLQRGARDELVRCAHPPDWRAVDGPTLPFGYTGVAVDRSLALQHAVREGRVDVFAATLTS